MRYYCLKGEPVARPITIIAFRKTERRNIIVTGGGRGL